jgi:glycosyltransferase involved in cell wall biosynthesis
MTGIPGSKAPTVALIVKGYPRLSETFIAQEIQGLEHRGLDFEIVSLRHPYDPTTHALHDRITAPVRYLPEYLYQEPARMLAGWRRARRLPGYRRLLRVWLRDLRRDCTANRIRRFGQALVLAAELPASIRLLYVHYLHTPASVARYTSILTGLPFCIAAHAKDIWTTPEWELQEKLDDCRWLTTCTRANRDHLAALAPTTDVFLTYHGLEAERFPAPSRTLGRDGSDPANPARLLGISRLVEKKGLDILLKALARLPAGLHWRYDHIGGGELKTELRAQAEKIGLENRITWRGALSQDQVIQACREADLFVLASRIAADGDRDGLPNVLMEAGTQALAAVASRVSAVPELIRDGENGRLVEPGNVEELAAAIADLVGDPQRRLAMGEAARRLVLEDFAAAPGIDRLAERLRAELEPAAPTSARKGGARAAA